jgi:methyl-accepting chemotaxis protein
MSETVRNSLDQIVISVDSSFELITSLSESSAKQSDELSSISQMVKVVENITFANAERSSSNRELSKDIKSLSDEINESVVHLIQIVE